MVNCRLLLNCIKYNSIQLIEYDDTQYNYIAYNTISYNTIDGKKELSNSIV